MVWSVLSYSHGSLLAFLAYTHWGAICNFKAGILRHHREILPIASQYAGGERTPLGNLSDGMH
jgi:hypothetical protein